MKICWFHQIFVAVCTVCTTISLLIMLISHTSHHFPSVLHHRGLGCRSWSLPCPLYVQEEFFAKWVDSSIHRFVVSDQRGWKITTVNRLWIDCVHTADFADSQGMSKPLRSFHPHFPLSRVWIAIRFHSPGEEAGGLAWKHRVSTDRHMKDHRHFWHLWLQFRLSTHFLWKGLYVLQLGKHIRFSSRFASGRVY